MPGSMSFERLPPAETDRPSFLWPAVLVVSLLLYVAVLLADVGSPIRPLMAAWFLLICPGLAVVPLARLRDPLVEVVAVLSVSLVLDLLVSMSLLYVGVWTWQRAVAVLGYFALLGAAAQVVRDLRWNGSVGVARDA